MLAAVALTCLFIEAAVPTVVTIVIHAYSFITLRAKLSGAVYCNRSCLWVCLFVYGVCYHDNSKLRASIFTKLGLLVKVVTFSS